MEDQVTDMAALVERLDKLVIAMTVNGAPKLWDADQLGEWLGVTAKVAKYTVAARPGFPAPFVPTSAREGKRLWFADEVIEWARKNRGVIPIGRKGGRPREAA